MSLTSESNMNLARQIFLKGVSAVVPSNLIRNQVEVTGSILKIQQQCNIDLDKYARCFIVGFGKAVLPMAEEMLRILENKVERCLLSVPEGTRQQDNTKIEMVRGAKNNIPDSKALQSAIHIVDIVKACTDRDLLIVLISGGGSALLPYPKPPITLEEKVNLIKRLSSAGASINELNSVRSKISVVKGGGLIRLCPANRIVSLILSDVLGDPLDVIASGPTFSSNHQNINTNTNCLRIIQKYMKESEVPLTIMKVLCESENEKLDILKNKTIDNIIIGNNKIALNAAGIEAALANLTPILINSSLEGEARDIGEKIAIMSHFVSQILNNSGRDSNMTEEGKRVVLTTLEFLGSTVDLGNDLLDKVQTARGLGQGHGVCLLFGGETTVKVQGKGIGGRNQELALSAAITLNSLSSSGNITILSAGTDGIDGPCDAAGAVINTSTCAKALEENIDPKLFLNNNDSYNFFKSVDKGQFHIVTGHTGTNVMDLIILVIRPHLYPQENSLLKE